MKMESRRASSFTSPVGRGRIALAIRVRGYNTLPMGEGARFRRREVPPVIHEI